MRLVAFAWQDPLYKLELLQFKEGRVMKPAAWWDEKEILGGRDEKTGGTFLACSKRGRVACLMNQTKLVPFGPAELLPVMFLKGKMSPEEFARQLAEDSDFAEIRSMEMTFNLIVADITINSMLYISKQFSSLNYIIRIEAVGPGVHTLSVAGLDSEDYKDLRLKSFFYDLFDNYKNKEQTPLRELAKEYMHDPLEICKRHTQSLRAIFVDKTFGNEENNRTTNVTELAVKHIQTKKMMFYELFFKNGEWKENDFFTFSTD